MLILAYDTETTGIMYGKDYTDKNAPFLASIAMILYDSVKNRIVSSLNSMIYPDGWTMPEEAEQINGLSNEYLCKVGIPSQVIMPAVMELMLKADLRVAHNIDFDTKIIASALWRHLAEESSENEAHKAVNEWLEMPGYCTMKYSKNIVGALDKAGRIKNPKLTEAYKFFFGKELDRAHSANADAIAVLELYIAINAEIKTI